MYQIDTSTGYSLHKYQQIGFAGLTQLHTVDAPFGPNGPMAQGQNQPTLVRQ